MSTRLLLAGALVVIAAAGARAQEQVEPDRPDVTNGTHLVDIGLLQIELGGLYNHPGEREHAFGSPLTVRVGIAEWLEARASSDGFVTQTDGVARRSGIGNTQVSAKVRLWADPGGVPVLSLLPSISFPTSSAASGFGSGDRDYTLTALTGTDMGRHWHLDGNYGIGRMGAGHGEPHFTQHLVSASASVAATGNLNPYTEIFWLSRQDPDGGAVAAIDGGAIYELGERYAVDGGVQVNLTSGSRDFSAFGGLSVIVGNVLGKHGVHARQRQVRRRQARRARAGR